jgi:hypothetical protein
MQKRRVYRHEVTQPLSESYRLIPLTRKQNAIVDVTDFDWLNQWNWCAQWAPHTNSFYAVRTNGKNGYIWMHTFILKCRKGQKGDHKNHNTLDNRRENLRKCTFSQNAVNRRMQRNNTSGFIGVTWHKAVKKWHAQTILDGKHVNGGFFDSPEEAARARDKMIFELHGPFASLNFPV